MNAQNPNHEYLQLVGSRDGNPDGLGRGRSVPFAYARACSRHARSLDGKWEDEDEANVQFVTYRRQFRCGVRNAECGISEGKTEDEDEGSLGLKHSLKLWSGSAILNLHGK
jgi:hypothetical protein